MAASNETYGLLAEFCEADELLEAARRAHAAGYTQMDAYSPFPIDGLAEAVGMRKNRVGLATLLGGITGGAFGYFMLYYANVIAYPLNVAGRPFHSWPSFIPITFELTILFAALGAVFGMLVLNRLPELYHPIFNGQHFERASQDRFFLAVEAADPLFDATGTQQFLAGLGATEVSEVTQARFPQGESTIDEPGTEASRSEEIGE